MDNLSLVEQITRAVLDEISRPGAIERAAAAIEPGPGRGAASTILCLLVEGGRDVDATCRRMRALPRTDLRWIFAVNNPQSLSYFKSLLGDLPGEWLASYPSSWGGLLGNVQLVVVPFLPLAFIAKLANLIADEPCLAAAAAALLEGKPILAGSEDINFMNLHSARMPKGFVEVWQGHVKTVNTLGLQLMDMRNLEGELRRSSGGMLYGTAGKQVITRDDIVAAHEAGRTSLDYGRGTIVTPLARDLSDQLGVELRMGIGN